MNQPFDPRTLIATKAPNLELVSGFSANQVRKLRRPIPDRQIRSRMVDGKALSFIEGWYAMAKANEIFGEGGWDRETISVQPLESFKQAANACGYVAKVRITVRAIGGAVIREGTGCGWSSDASAPSQERALKAAETDATKRALCTFGAAFGLSLYDPQGMGRSKACYTLFAPDGTVLSANLSAESYCSGFRQLIALCATYKEIEELSRFNLLQLEQLRASAPDLKNGHGLHFVDLLLRLMERARHRLVEGPEPADVLADPTLSPAQAEGPGIAIDKSALTFGHEKRYRDKAHLQMVRQLPCLICNRQPSHAHHLKFAQSKGMAQKVSDEYVVPLCSLHHGDLHRAGREEIWWQSQNVDPLPVAAELWARHRAGSRH